MKSLKLKALVIAASLVAATLSTTASAALDSIATTSDGYNFYGHFTHALADPVNGYSVNDTIALPLTSKDLIGTLSGSVVNIKGTSINFSVFDLIDTATNSVVINGTVFGGAKAAFGYFDGSTLASTYAIHIVGSSIGAANYAGTLSVTSAVPEPETYGMMLAGLGLMGFVARRRKSV